MAIIYLRRYYIVVSESTKSFLQEIRSFPRNVQHLLVFILLVGLHSMFLGIFIFFFTELFYRLFFHAEIQNFFFVRQAGLFLFCLGLFNLAILKEMRRYHYFVKVIIVTKMFATLFLMSNAHLATFPTIIYLAGVGDGLIAVLLSFIYERARLSR